MKAPTENEITLADFESYYLYGLTDNPFRQSRDITSFSALYQKVIGRFGGVLIGSSFHPYQLVNVKGATVWQAAFFMLYASKQNEKAFHAIQQNNLVLVDPSPSFSEILVWPDKRLTYEENPVFSRYVPFVIPFCIYRPAQQTVWDLEIAAGMATKGNASDYVEEITDLTRFLMPQPSFILGLDMFEEASPESLIENFIQCKGMLGA